MSFGWSGSDVFLLAQLAWNTVQNSRKACGEYDELTREALRLHAVLQRLEQEVAKPESPINRPGETSKEQLQRVAIDCEVVLKQLDKIVAAYASLSEEKRSARKIWKKVRFGNGQMADLGDLRSKLMLYTSEMLLYLNLVSMSTVGRIEQRMDQDGGVLRDIKIAVEKKTAHTVLCGGNREGSVLTTYADDDTRFWRGLRRDLIKDGLPSVAIHKHKHLIKKYVKELAARGILDDDSSKETEQQQHAGHEDFEISEEDQELANERSVNFNAPQTHDRNASVQSSENHIEKSLGYSYSFNGVTVEDISESEFPCIDPRVTASQISKEQSQTTNDYVGIPSGAEIKFQLDCNSSDTLEPAGERGSQETPPLISVPSRPAKKRSRTSKNKTDTSRRDTATAAAPDYAAQNNTSNPTSSFYRFFQHSTVMMQGDTDFVITPAGVCHKVSTLLINDFGQRINVILECLPVHDIRLPQTVPGDNPYYVADIGTITSFAHSAQQIIRDTESRRRHISKLPPTSLVDFRPEEFFDVTQLTRLNNIFVGFKFPQDLYLRIVELIASFDGQCYDVIDRVKHFDNNAWKSSAYPRHTMPSRSPPTREDAYDNVLSHQQSPHMHSSGMGGGIPEVKYPSTRRSETMPVDPMGPINPVPLTSSNLKNIPTASKIPSMRRSETMPVDQMRSANPIPLKPSKIKKEALWTTSDVSSDSGFESMEVNYSSPRQKIQSRRGQSRRTPSRSGMGSGSSNVLFGESGSHDETDDSPETSEDEKPQQYLPDDPPPHVEGVSIRSDGSSQKHKAASSRTSEGSSPLDMINAINENFQTEYEPQCREFQKNPPPDANERKKLYNKLNETIMQNIVLKADALTTNAGDGMLRVKRLQLVVDAQSALARLDQVMRDD